jgi:hypothetical protein
MIWKFQQHKVGESHTEISVSILVKEMAEYQASLSETWADEFHKRLKELPRSNNFSADNMFKAIPKDLLSLEVWKLKANGDFNYKMFAVTKNKES